MNLFKLILLCPRYWFGDNWLYDFDKLKMRGQIVFLHIFQIVILELFILECVNLRSKAAIQFVYYLAFALWITSYYRASYAQAFTIPPSDISSLPGDRVCHRWRKWKPERAFHCDKWKKWVLKQDTHFFTIANCVGYHNEKFFVLYMFYSVMIGLIYINLSWRFSFTTKKVSDLSILSRIVYYICNLQAYIHFLLNFMLFMLKFFGVYSNMTMNERSEAKLTFNNPWCPKNLENLGNWSHLVFDDY